MTNYQQRQKGEAAVAQVSRTGKADGLVAPDATPEPAGAIIFAGLTNPPEF